MESRRLLYCSHIVAGNVAVYVLWKQVLVVQVRDDFQNLRSYRTISTRDYHRTQRTPYDTQGEFLERVGIVQVL